MAKQLLVYAEHDASKLPRDIGYIEVSVCGGDENETQAVIDYLIPMYDEIWATPPNRIYTSNFAGVEPDTRDMTLVWEDGINVTDDTVKQLVEENKRLKQFADSTVEQLGKNYEYIDDLHALIPRKKLEKLWSKRASQ